MEQIGERVHLNCLHTINGNGPLQIAGELDDTEATYTDPLLRGELSNKDTKFPKQKALVRMLEQMKRYVKWGHVVGAALRQRGQKRGRTT